jgi:hypothetical protein
VSSAHGSNLYTQAIGLSPSANPLGVITSHGVHPYLAPPVLTPPPVGSLYQPGLLGQIQVQPHTGYVVRFE